MEQNSGIQVPRLKLGSQGLEVSRVGFGCGSLSGILNAPLSHEDGAAILKHAFYKGVTLFDTSDIYGERGHNEIMIGKALKDLPREQVQLASKFGICMSNITALQMEYSLWSREIEQDIIPLCRELGIGIVAYSPLGRGFFGGKGVVESLPSESLLTMHPRFIEDNRGKNKVLYEQFAGLAAKRGCSPPQLALAWLLNQGDDIVPIPGTTKIKNLESNIGALALKLTAEEMEEISDAVPVDEVGGEREYAIFSDYAYKVANTPRVK